MSGRDNFRDINGTSLSSDRVEQQICCCTSMSYVRNRHDVTMSQKMSQDVPPGTNVPDMSQRCPGCPGIMIRGCAIESSSFRRP